VVHHFHLDFFFGEAGIRTHVQGGSDRESSAFNTRPGGSPNFGELIVHQELLFNFSAKGVP